VAEEAVEVVEVEVEVNNDGVREAIDRIGIERVDTITEAEVADDARFVLRLISHLISSHLISPYLILSMLI